MNLKDAIKSGKNIKRTGWFKSGKVVDGVDQFMYTRGDIRLEGIELRPREIMESLTLNDVFAEDWEIVEPTISLTELELKDLFLKKDLLNIEDYFRNKIEKN